MNANRMAELFQVNLDSSLDEDIQGAPAVTFAQKSEDAQAVLKPVPVNAEVKKTVTVTPIPQDNELIHAAIRSGTTYPPVDFGKDINDETDDIDDEIDIPGDVLEEVQADIKKFQAQIGDENTDTPSNYTPKVIPAATAVSTPEVEPDYSEPATPKPITKAKTVEAVVPAEIPNTPCKDVNNPLGLDGQDLKAYHAIKEKYGDKFTLYDGSLAYRDFYKYKVHALRHLLGQFPLLNLSEMRTELAEVQTNHFIGDDVCTPDLIRVKLDSAQAHRTRLSSLLTTAFAQHPAWERFLDMSRSKLWKDHDVKGSHRRDGMVMEHLSDMESYVANLKGFIDSAKQYDAMLKSAAESLSRQLTCLQLNEYTGTNRVEGRETPQKIRPPISPSTDLLEDLDAVDTGTVISAPRPKANEAVTTVSYGREDEFSQLG